MYGVPGARFAYNAPPADDGASAGAGGGGRLLQAPGTTTLNYIFFNDPTSMLPSPEDLVNSFSVTSDLVAAFAAIGLNYDATNNLAGSVTIFPNPRPAFASTPATVPAATKVTVTATFTISGTMFAQLVKDEERLPSSR
jgi:hypothetical protein